MGGCFALLLAAAASGDTLQLKSGIQVDGKIVSQGADTVTVNAGGNTVLYRANEILRIEPNERTGELNLEQLQQEVAEYQRKIQAETGLDVRQHGEIQQLLEKAQSTDESISGPAKERLVEMGKTMPLFKYLEHFLPEYSPRLVPPVLEVMFRIDALRARPILRAHCTDADARSRGTALEFSGQAKDPDAAELVARGLLDYDYYVLCAAAAAAGGLKLQGAAPLLIARLDDSVDPLVLACEKALTQIWGQERPPAQQDRKAFWASVWQSNASAVPVHYEAATLQPLVPPGTTFVDE